MDLFNDIGAEFQLFFSNLNWLYVFLFSILIHGIKNKEEFIWYNNLFDKFDTLKTLKIWIAGIILMLIQCLFCYLKNNSDFDSEYVSELLRSWLAVIVFNSFITDKIQKAEDKAGKD